MQLFLLWADFTLQKDANRVKMPTERDEDWKIIRHSYGHSSMTLQLSYIKKYLEIKWQGISMSSYGQKNLIFG